MMASLCQRKRVREGVEVYSVLVWRKPRVGDLGHASRELRAHDGREPSPGQPCRSERRRDVRWQFARALCAPVLLLAAAVLLAGCVTDNPDGTTTGTARLTARANVRVHAPRLRTAVRRPAIPLPDAALLKRQPPPDCQLNTQPAGVNPTEVRVAVLDYERQCYRQVEGIVRERLDRLQDAVGKTVKAVKDIPTHAQ
jgi:hypothetical protein